MAPVCLRAMTAEEHATVKTLAHSRTAAACLVERAQIIWRASRGETTADIAAHVQLDAETVRKRIHRFNAEGLEGLKDKPRSGHPFTYTPEQIAIVIATALTKPQALGLPFAAWTLDRLAAYLHELTKPQALGLPFAAWTLDRLAAYLHEHKDIPIQRSRINEILLQEGLRWRKHETWFGERVDPAFAEKRRALKRSTPHPL